MNNQNSKQKEFLEKIEKELNKEKESIENSLKSFSEKDKSLKDDWDSHFPKMGAGNLEESADSVEEYGNALPVEFSLENRLKDINLALQKIKNGEYGNCEECRKEIPQDRLEAFPEAKTRENCMEN